MSLNKVSLIGHCGGDPELRFTINGTPVCTFSVATTDKFKGRDGQPQEKTEWHNIVIWGKLAEIAGKYLRKGKQVYLGGKLTTRSYDGKDGVKRYVTEIVVDDLQMLGGGGERENPRKTESRTEEPPPHEGTSYDDEIPF